MKTFHSPRCRITWTNVISDGVDRDVIIPNRSLTLIVGLDVDPNIQFQAGYFYIDFALFQDGQKSSSTWVGWIPTQFPFQYGQYFWVSYSWQQANHLTNRGGIFLFQPQLTFWIIVAGGGGQGFSEFAVAEEEHYVLKE